MIFSRMLPQDLGTDLPERAAKDLEFIVDAATHMRLLLESMFDLSRVNTATLHWAQVNLALLIDSARQASAPTIAAANAIITNDPLPTVWGDHDLLMQLYQHLLSNAIKFCAQPPPVIHLTATLQGLQVVLGVQDNGIGIHSAYHEQIFAPFKRLHGRGEYEGSGMGLAICRKIVERHGGNIWVESDSGQGAHVKFTLFHHTAPASLREEALAP
jgi:signal transduction histidine kinase